MGPGRGEGGEGRSDLGRREGSGAPGEGGEDGGQGSRLKLTTALLPVGGAAEGEEAWGPCLGAVRA